jgi:hypothetical protein
MSSSTSSLRCACEHEEKKEGKRQNKRRKLNEAEASSERHAVCLLQGEGKLNNYVGSKRGPARPYSKGSLESDECNMMAGDFFGVLGKAVDVKQLLYVG